MNKFVSILVTIMVFMSLALDFMGAKLIKDAQTTGADIDIYGIYFLCTFCTVVSVVAFFVEFDLIEFRISPKRFAYAFRCFRSYYTKENFCSSGVIRTIINSFQSSHYFFLKSFKG